MSTYSHRYAYGSLCQQLQINLTSDQGEGLLVFLNNFSRWFMGSTLQVETHVMLTQPITLIVRREANHLVLDLFALAYGRHIA